MSIEDKLKAASAVEILDTYEMGPAIAVPSREPTDQIAADGADAGSSKDADASSTLPAGVLFGVRGL